MHKVNTTTRLQFCDFLENFMSSSQMGADSIFETFQSLQSFSWSLGTKRVANPGRRDHQLALGEAVLLGDRRFERERQCYEAGAIPSR